MICGCRRGSLGQYCYLKPHYLDLQTSYFEHLERGAI